MPELQHEKVAIVAKSVKNGWTLMVTDGRESREIVVLSQSGDPFTKQCLDDLATAIPCEVEALRKPF